MTLSLLLWPLTVIALLASAADIWRGLRGAGTWIAAAVLACLGMCGLGILGVLKPTAAVILGVLTGAIAVVIAVAGEGSVARVLGGETLGGLGRLVSGAAALAGGVIRGEDEDEPAAPASRPAMPEGAAPFKPAPGAAPAGAALRPAAIRIRRPAVAAGPSGAVAAPGSWGAIAQDAADFRPESNIDWAHWVASQVLGMITWGEGVDAHYEAMIAETGVDPASVAPLEDVLNAIALCAETSAAAVNYFCAYHELPDVFIDNGGILAHDGKWHQGSPSL